MKTLRNSVISVLLVFCLAISMVSVPYQRVQAAGAKKMAKEVCRIVNKERTKRGKQKLVLSPELNRLACKRAKELVKKFSHTRPDGSDCFSILEENDVSYMTCGENIAAGQPGAKAVMNDWMHSTGHRANILKDDFGKLGVGYYKASKGYRYYWVQIFTD